MAHITWIQDCGGKVYGKVGKHYVFHVGLALDGIQYSMHTTLPGIKSSLGLFASLDAAKQKAAQTLKFWYIGGLK